MRRALTLLAVLWMTSATAAVAGDTVTVMTRNLYLGADLAPVVTAATPAEFFAAASAALEQIAANDFPERAQALAAEIVEKNPDLVGLQEVFNFTLDGANGPTPFRDYLVDLLSALTAQGASYVAVATVQNLNLLVPIPGLGVVGVTDRDVILARSDVSAAVVPVAATGCRASMDGCNYQVIASATSPFGTTIPIERGFVAVDALVSGRTVRLANTHLELMSPDPTNPLSPFIQSLQALELISILSAFPNPLGSPILVIGDLNSSPDDPTLVVGPYTIVPPYQEFVVAGYLDTWTLRPGRPPGFTCCQLADLLNPESILGQRIDIVFAGVAPAGVKANDVGNDETDKTATGLWPSDHAGVVARLDFAP